MVEIYVQHGLCDVVRSTPAITLPRVGLVVMESPDDEVRVVERAPSGCCGQVRDGGTAETGRDTGQVMRIGFDIGRERGGQVLKVLKYIHAIRFCLRNERVSLS